VILGGMAAPLPTITAEDLWLVHSAALGGKSAITGQSLPPSLSVCPSGVKASHYAMALYAAIATGAEEPPVPPGLSAEQAESVAAKVRAMVGQGDAAPAVAG